MIVLIPAYEPDARLLDLIDALRAADPGIGLVVVDDGSGPIYRLLFEEACQRGAVVLTHEVNRGKGAALKTGFRYLSSVKPDEEVVCADCDGQHSVVDVLRVAERVRSGEEFVLGARRFTGKVPARSRVGNSATRVLFRLATGVNLTDTQTGLRGYAGPVLPWLLVVPGDRFEYELNSLLRSARERRPIAEVEIATIYLEGNASSHFRPLIDSARIYGPLLTFLASSLAAFFIDLVALFVLHAVTGALLVSVVGARVISGSVNFAVNRRVVFGAAGTRPPGAAALRYGLLAAGLLTANYCLLRSFTAAGADLMPAKVLTEVLLVAVSYTAQRFIVFRASRPERRAQVPAPRTSPAAPSDLQSERNQSR